MRKIGRWLLLTIASLALFSILAVLVLRWVPPPTSSVMLQRTLSEARSQDFRWVPLQEIAPAAALAVVAAEDQKFPSHWGFDLEAIWDAVFHHAQGGRLRGASTLTQQVARNLFLWQGRSYLRKALEAWFTGVLELLWPKERILEVYLNIAEMGERTFGIESASQNYFGRSACRISRGQAALLAAVLPNPRRYRADQPSHYVTERQRWILRQMEQLGGTIYLRGILPRNAGASCDPAAGTAPAAGDWNQRRIRQEHRKEFTPALSFHSSRMHAILEPQRREPSTMPTIANSEDELRMKTVKHILEKKGYEVWSLSADQTVYEALVVMAEKNVGALTILLEGRLIGVFTERDYSRSLPLAERSSKETKIGEVMTRRVAVVHPEQAVEECMALMTEKRVRHLPVLDGEQLVGIVSIGDLVKSIIAEQQFIIEQLERYITG